jgi:deoxyribose-phosphate aldolase
MTQANIAQYIDHTLLKPDAAEHQVHGLCDEARQYGFYSVCVHPTWVALCSDLLAGSSVKICTVVGFPLGATLSAVKAFETQAVTAQGAQEVDMVINVGLLKSGDHDAVRQDIAAVVQAAHAASAHVKVIIETALLSDDEKVAACELAMAANADFVKTSTGFSGGGATIADVALMRRLVGDKLGVKAAGGIRTAGDARAMLEAGANRLGTSAGIQIVREALERGEGKKIATGSRGTC